MKDTNFTFTQKSLRKNQLLKNKILKNKTIASLVLLMSTAAISSMSMAAAPVDFSHQDWQVVCDNTRTCRLAGYQAEGESDFPVSILLTRRAGANASVEGKVKLGGAKDSSAKALMQLGNRHRISLIINDKDLGETNPFSGAAGDAELTSAQVSALLEALTKSSKIELVVRNSRWQLSDKGASAVMIKADEAQGRVGTSSAFISSDTVNKSNNSVLSPKPVPSLRLVVPNEQVTSSGKKFSMKSSQLTALMQKTVTDISKDCPKLSDNSSWRVSRLNSTQLLAQHNCWNGAYNAGMGIWVLNDSKPHKPVLITNNATSYEKGKISAVQKGRGMADCLYKAEWVWTGNSFAKSHESTTGLCRMVEAGGAWQLPTYVAKVN